MSDATITVVSLTISGSLLLLALIALRPLLKKRITRTAQYYLWLLVVLRLAFPVTFDGSAMNRLFAQAAPRAVYTTAGGGVGTSAQGLAQQGGGQIAMQMPATANSPQNAEAAAEDTRNPVQPAAKPFAFLAFAVEHQTAIWLLGAAVHFLWFLAAYLRFARGIEKTNVRPHPLDTALFRRLRGGARVKLACNPHVDTPMLIGLFSPRIVIPQIAFVQNGMGQELQHILQHELTHYYRRDLLYKWFAVFVSSLHWFNPLMIRMRREINRACELSCDEAVISRLDAAGRRRYGDTLLGLAAGNKLPSGIVTTTMSEEKRQLKERLLGIKGYKGKTAFSAALALTLFLLLAGCGAALGAAGGRSGGNPALSDPGNRLGETPPVFSSAAKTALPTPVHSPAPHESEPDPANTDVNIAFEDDFLNRYYALSQEEQFVYHSLGSLYFNAHYASEGDTDDAGGYLDAVIAYVKTYMKNNGVPLPEDVLISTVEEGTPFYEQGKVSAKLYVTEFGVRDTADAVRPIATLVELEADFHREESFPRNIARMVLQARNQGKRLELHYSAEEDNGPPRTILARFFIPHVPLEESQSECYALVLENGVFIRQTISLEEWRASSGN